jgi:hypothetical protein
MPVLLADAVPLLAASGTGEHLRPGEPLVKTARSGLAGFRGISPASSQGGTFRSCDGRSLLEPVPTARTSS